MYVGGRCLDGGGGEGGGGGGGGMGIRTGAQDFLAVHNNLHIVHDMPCCTSLWQHKT